MCVCAVGVLPMLTAVLLHTVLTRGYTVTPVIMMGCNRLPSPPTQLSPREEEAAASHGNLLRPLPDPSTVT